ncbi:MAG TPA: hypothetical protein VIJ92_16385 [Ginsengibacter sp.]
MKNKEIKIIRGLIVFFIAALFVSGLTAIPIDVELSALLPFFSADSFMHYWLQKVLSAYSQVNTQYPFLLYGYDWLAFAHFVLAILFIGPYKDPVKNIWVIEFGLIACVLIFPLAFIAGHFRGIPLGWQLIDCSFGVFGFVPLWICYRKIKNSELKNVV